MPGCHLHCCDTSAPPISTTAASFPSQRYIHLSLPLHHTQISNCSPDTQSPYHNVHVFLQASNNTQHQHCYNTSCYNILSDPFKSFSTYLLYPSVQCLLRDFFYSTHPHCSIVLATLLQYHVLGLYGLSIIQVYQKLEDSWINCAADDYIIDLNDVQPKGKEEERQDP